MNHFTVPVKLKPDTADMIQGILEADGMLGYRDGGVTLEYRTTNYQHTSLARSRSSVQSLRLEMRDLQAITLKKGILEHTILLRPNSLSVLDNVPGAAADGLRLRVERRYREEAEQLVSYVSLALAEYRLDQEL